MPCSKCAAFGGRWMETPKGLVPCTCPEGNPLREKPVSRKPVLSSEEATVFVEMLASIPFFPGESGARLAIGDELRAMCGGYREADWLVTRMRRLYRRWPGPLEMRHVYCSKFKAWDGVHPVGISEVYPDGIPSEREAEQRQIAAPAVKLLPSGQVHEVIQDPKVERAVQRLAQRMPKMPSGKPIGGDGRFGQFESTLRELETAPQDRSALSGPTPQLITQSDIDRAVEDLRRGKMAAAGDGE